MRSQTSQPTPSCLLSAFATTVLLFSTSVAGAHPAYCADIYNSLRGPLPPASQIELDTVVHVPPRIGVFDNITLWSNKGQSNARNLTLLISDKRRGYIAPSSCGDVKPICADMPGAMYYAIITGPLAGMVMLHDNSLPDTQVVFYTPEYVLNLNNWGGECLDKKRTKLKTMLSAIPKQRG